MAIKIMYFVHGTTKDNEAKVASGWNPGELSEKGISQAIALRDLIDRDSIEFVFCSDLQRAIDSTEVAFVVKEVDTKLTKVSMRSKKLDVAKICEV